MLQLAIYDFRAFLNIGMLLVESENEKDILSKIYNIDVDVLKVGHHGSDTSSTEAFLRVVSPEYAIIIVGDNNYGHPNNVVLDRLYSLGSQIYRTDKEVDALINKSILDD